MKNETKAKLLDLIEAYSDCRAHFWAATEENVEKHWLDKMDFAKKEMESFIATM